MQPIAAGITNAQTALRLLGFQPPNMDEVREAVGGAVEEGNRAIDVIDRIRALIKKAPPRKDGLKINEAILEVIARTHGEVVKNGASVQTQLAEGLPLIQGDRVQLQQVILNLIINAVQAMSGVSTTVSQKFDHLRLVPTGQARGVRQEGAPVEPIEGRDGRGDMAFRPHRECPAA